MQVITNASVAVDTFLLMSGLLVSYGLIKQLDDNKGRFNPIKLYLHRYLRLVCQRQGVRNAKNIRPPSKLKKNNSRNSSKCGEITQF